MVLKRLKLELFFIKKSFFIYHRGFKYLFNRYILARKILRSKKILEKPVNNDDLSIHVLTSHYDLIMLVWSLGSFYSVSKIIGQLFIHNDGSLNNDDRETIKRLFPGAVIIEPNAIFERLKDYPMIQEFRGRPQYFLLKKLVDPYFVSDKPYHLIIDSDLLWISQPENLEKEIRNECNNSLMMLINRECPVYFKGDDKISKDLSLFNSGVVLYRKDNFDLSELSKYLKKIDISREENSHFIEQAGYAVILKNLKPLPDKHMAVGHLQKDTVIAHFTSPSRPLFYIEGLEATKNKILTQD